MTHCYNYLQIYFFSFYEFTREGESKITLTFSYYFHIGRSEPQCRENLLYILVLNNFIRIRATAKSNNFKSLFGNEKHHNP